MKNAAPVAPYISTASRWLTSTKVGCFAYTGAAGRAPDPDLHQVGAEQEKDRKTRAGGAIASPARFHSTPDSTTLPTTCCDT